MAHPAGQAELFIAETVHDQGEFAALAGEWNKLYQATTRSTPFQSHAWLYAWWQAYGNSHALHIVLVRDRAGHLVAAAPLYLRRQSMVRVLAPLGGAQSDFTDVLIAERTLAPQDVSAVTDALTDALRRARGWDVLDLPEVREGAAGELLFQSWTGARWSVAASTCMELHACSFDDLLKQLSSKRAGEARRRLRRADTLGLVAAAVPPEDVPQGVADLVRLHAAQWQGRGINPEHLRPRFAQHLEAALGIMVREGQAVLTRFWLDGELVIVTLDLVGHDMVCGYLMGVAPSLYEKIDVTTYVLRHELQRMTASGLSVFNMLRGREPYKARWHPVVAFNRRVLLGRPGAVLCRPFAGAVLLSAHAAVIARDRASWVRGLRRRGLPRARACGSSS